MVDNNPIKYDIIIPDFFEKMFYLSNGYTMLIKGEAGTGKTTLAMELCIQWLKKSHIIYLSTRSNIFELKKQYAWFLNEVGEGSVIDLESIQLSEKRVKMLNIDSENFLQVFIHFEKLLQEYKNLDKEKPEGERKKIIVIIDSIDKIIDVMRNQSSFLTDNKVYENFIRFTRKYGLRTVIITEIGERTKTDYLVDGIITLVCDTTTVKDRILRVIKVNKLRNISIEHHELLFSLYQGRFRMIRPHKPRLSLLPFKKRLENIYGALKGNFLSQYFFVNLLQAGQLMIDVEFDSNEILHFIYMFFLNACLLNNYSVFFVAPPEFDIVQLELALESCFGREHVERYYRTGFIPRTSYREEMAPNIFYSQSDDFLEELRDVKTEFQNLKHQKGSNGIVFILPLDHIFNSYTHDNLPNLYQFIYSEKLLGPKDTLIATNLRFKNMDPLHARFSDSFSARILFYLHGLQLAKTLMFYWVKMPRPLYALYAKFDESKRFVKVKDVFILPIR
ncbi:MAG: gas vesicle protein GvpD P-loop domain-containing protein [Promethearchaeota archaeon]